MIKYSELYEENKRLEKLFNESYPPNEEIFRKNILGLLVEIGELANETRCFKYWSVKPMSDKHIVLDELADCIILIFVFLADLNISLDEEFNEPENYDLIDEFIYLYGLCSNIKENNNKEYIKNIFVNFIYLGRLLNYTDEDIIDACMKKINKNKERIEDIHY